MLAGTPNCLMLFLAVSLKSSIYFITISGVTFTFEVASKTSGVFSFSFFTVELEVCFCTGFLTFLVIGVEGFEVLIVGLDEEHAVIINKLKRKITFLNMYFYFGQM